MYSISAKVLLWLVALLVFLSSCSREGPEPLWEAESPFGNDYKGGLFPVYIKLKEPVDNANRISWHTRYANIAYRKQAINSKEQITADTAFLYWETRPPVYVKFDSTKTKVDTTVSWKIDTTYYYRDTVFAIVDNSVESLPIVIEIKNILPRIKNITVGGIKKPGDSLLTIAANLGDKLTISLELEKPFEDSFNKAFHTIVTMPQIMGSLLLNRESSSDNIFVYDWRVPNEIISDSSSYLKIEDSGGFGERLYKIHLITYTECGSVWVAAENELVKYSPEGTEVARISGNFESISDISVNSKKLKLFVVDESKNSFSIYNNYGKLLYSDTSLFQLPSGVAVDVVGDYVWVSDAKDPIDTLYRARLRRYSLIADSISFSSVGYEMAGPVKGLAINQFQSDFVWFAIPKGNKVGFTMEPPNPKFVEPKLYPSPASSSSSVSSSSSPLSSSSVSSSSFYSSSSSESSSSSVLSSSSASYSSASVWNRPSIVSIDPSNGMAWIADSSRIIAIDTSGKILAKITGFGPITSVSASNGNVWASDKENGRVYLFKGQFKGSMQDTSLTVISAPGRRVIDGFIAPISVSAYFADGGAWVVDKEAGRVIRLDSLGNKIASGTGLKQPILGKTLQIAE